MQWFAHTLIYPQVEIEVYLSTTERKHIQCCCIRSWT